MRSKVLLAAILGVLGSVSVQAKNCEQGSGPQCQQQQQQVSGSKQSKQSQQMGNKQHKAQAQNRDKQSMKAANQSHQNNAYQAKNQNRNQSKVQHNQTASQHSAQSKGMYVVKANRLNVRNEPGNGGKVHGRFQGGQQVEVFQIIDGWAKVLFNGQYQWVSAQYLQQAGK